jgi:membrane protein implicated in regulation of membrane protease activity
VDERLRAAWAATMAVAIGGLWLLFVAGPRVETLLVAIVAAAATFLGLEALASWRGRRGR